MKKIHIILISILCGLSSCTSVLDKEPLDIISDDVLWNDPVLIDNYLLQCYAEMCFFNEMPYGATQDWFNCMYATGFADESTSAWTQTPKTHWLNISGGDWDWWGYPTVRKLNVFIEKMETAPVDEAVRTARTAEARFLRAFAYFNMVKRYGGVPLILKAQQLSDSPEELYPKRATEEAVYQFILDEMNDIIDNRLLPDAYGAADLGRPTLYAAAALKSRAAMYAGSIASWGTVQIDGLVGIPADKKEHFWQESLNASNRLLYGSTVRALREISRRPLEKLPEHLPRRKQLRGDFLRNLRRQVGQGPLVGHVAGVRADTTHGPADSRTASIWSSSSRTKTSTARTPRSTARRSPSTTHGRSTSCGARKTLASKPRSIRKARHGRTREPP